MWYGSTLQTLGEKEGLQILLKRSVFWRRLVLRAKPLALREIATTQEEFA
jgi:hypothetical protein